MNMRKLMIALAAVCSGLSAAAADGLCANN